MSASVSLLQRGSKIPEHRTTVQRMEGRRRCDDPRKPTEWRIAQRMGGSVAMRRPADVHRGRFC
eukprot:1728568-Pyramimonas_sp.AAC.1